MPVAQGCTCDQCFESNILEELRENPELGFDELQHEAKEITVKVERNILN